MLLLLMLISNIYSIEEDEKETYYINFDLSNVTFKYKNESEKIENIVTNEKTINLPKIQLVKEGFYFNGWTSDFIYGFLPGEVINLKEKNTTLFPVFEDQNDTTYFRFEYKVEYNGEIIDTSKRLRPSTQRAKHFIQIVIYTYTNDNASTRGWTDGINTFDFTDRFIMPRKNVTLYAIFHNFRLFSYVHGDVDGINGDPYAPFRYTEGAIIDLAESTRLYRKGYTIVGWHCDYDGKDYPIFYSYILPDADVVMTAIWEPKEYKILFMTHAPSIPNISITAKTKEIIIVPNIKENREGYIFNGWLIDGQQYIPGDEYIVKGIDLGLGISGDAVWIKN